MRDIPGYLVENKTLYVNLLEVLRRGSAQVLDGGEDGILLYEQGCGAHMMSARDKGAFARLMAQVPEGCGLFVGHELWYKDRAAERLGLKDGQICYSAAYWKREPLPVPEFGGELRLLGQEHAEFVNEHYDDSFGGVEYIRRAIRRGMLGAFVDGELVGFAGFHEEGSIGMLEVLPGYRRRGLGEVLERGAIDLALERGQYPFGQIIEGNEASLALQRKVGMEISEERMFWLF